MNSPFVALTRAASMFAVCVLLLAACVKPATELVVVIDTDFQVTAELDEVAVAVIGPSGARTDTRADLTAAGAPTLPLTLALVPATESLGPVTVTAIGRLRGRDVVTQTRRTNFLQGQSRTLSIVLLRSCAGVSCPAAQSCDQGSCRSVDVAANSLPAWTGTATRLDGGARDGTTDTTSRDMALDVVSNDLGVDALGLDEAPVLDAEIEAGDDAGLDDGVDAGIEIVTPPEAAVDAPTDISRADVGADTRPDVVVDSCVPTEICNGRDDNCNGMIDEGFDLMTSLANCGMCGRVCAPTRAASAACVAGVCTITTCSAGYGDCNRNATDGCEATFTATSTCGRCNHACIGTATCTAGSCSDDQPAEISGGGDLACVRRASGVVSCWGDNTEGQLGDGTMTTRRFPVDVLGLVDATQVRVGAHAVCALRRSGAVVCWGQNADAELGTGAIGAASPRPVTVMGLTDAVEIAVGRHHGCARRAGGSVVCWGRNASGQVGDGTTILRSAPVAVMGLLDAVEIASYGYTTCARRMTGALVCWGAGATGATGDGGLVDRRTPVVVTAITDAVQLAMGYQFACARRATGAVVCWGMNDFGQMGDGTTSGLPRGTPGANVTGLTDAVEITVGYDQACARRATGAVVCWGANASGQTGDGLRTPSNPTPVPVVGISDAVEIANLDVAGCARRATRAVVCWGNNGLGQIGDGTTSTFRLAPTNVLFIP